MSPLAQYIAQTAVTLVGVGVLAWLIVYAGRRVGFQRDEGSMKFRGRLTLEGRRAIYLVEVGDKVLVLGASEAGLTKLAELPGSEFEERAIEPPRGFREVLSRVLGKSPSVLASPPSATHSTEALSTPEDEELR